MAEKEFFRISDARSAKEIMIKSSASKLTDQIKSPNLLALTTIRIAPTNGIKIKKAARKNPAKYPKINCSREIDFEMINSTSLFSKARLMLRQTNRIMPIVKMARDEPAM